MARLIPSFKALEGRRVSTLLVALWKLFRHPETPRSAKWVAVAVIAYAVSPIDLIPDFIPVLGQLDDLILVPLGIALVVRLTPAHLWQARLAEAEQSGGRVPRMLWGAAAIVLIWVALAGAGLWWWSGRAEAAPVARALPAEIAGTVRRVVDGDTLWLDVAPPGARPLVVRIEGIDAPEICQPGGEQARRALIEHVNRRAVTLRPSARDDFGRTVGTLRLEAEDIGERLVRDGHAWSQHFRGSGAYAAQERLAIASKRGLHAMPNALMPREFRRLHGACDAAKPDGVRPAQRAPT